MREGCCREHKNPGQLICLHEKCTQRLMCMLCEHNHQLYVSIRAKTQVQLKHFKKTVDDAIDQSLKAIDSIENGGIDKEKKMVAQYYDNIKDDIIKFVDLKMNQNLALFSAKSGSDVHFLIKSRIQGKYHQLAPELFTKIKQVYQGKDLQSIARQQLQRHLQAAYNYMKQFHDTCLILFQKFKIQLKVKIPQIRIKQGGGFKNHRLHVSQYDGQVQKTKLKQQIKYVNNLQIQQIISDAYSGKKQIITVGFDKFLRVFDKNLRIVYSKEYNNILTKIQKIGDDVFAIGVSKQLHINRISYEEGYDPKNILILKGHTQRIWDISAFNTRVIGSCSEEGTKIWDLYKQKCQFTLRQQINPACLSFMNAINSLAIGYHSHQLKIYSISNMRPSRSYLLSGVPLYISQENRNQNLIYCGGFSSDLKLFDIRVSKQVFSQNFKSEAVTTFKQSLFDEQTILIGERGGKVRIFDLRKLKSRLDWDAHSKMTNLSKPNGVVRIFQQGLNQVLTVGCNDKRAIIWKLHDQQ